MICIVRTRTLNALHATCARVTELEAAEASVRATATAATVEADRLRDRLTQTEIALTSTRTGAVRAAQEHLEQQEELLGTLGAIVEKLTPSGGGSPSSTAVAEALTLAARYVPTPAPAEEAKVWVALRRRPGVSDHILSVHPSEEGARTAVERDGACPKGWQGLTRLDPLTERSSFSGWQIRGVPVQGWWADPSNVALIISSGSVLRAYGERFDAYEALDNVAHEARQAGVTGLTGVEVHRVVQHDDAGKAAI